MYRKERTRMSTTKDRQPVRRVIIQEGVYTFETTGPTNAVAEPVVYLFGECVIGGFYRIHTSRGVDENLNAPGMHFQPLPFSSGCDAPCDASEADSLQNRLYVYGVIAQLSMLAAAREISGESTKG
jgi:glutamate--cysteine ligase